MPDLEPLDAAHLPTGVTSRFIPGVNGLRVHLLEAGSNGDPLIVLLHGFPELAYSWRKIMRPLAAAGFHVIAPDLRGYGRTTGWDASYDGDLTPFGLLNLVRDTLTLVTALGRTETALVVGHDFGSSVASACALIRPDVFRAVALMSAPFGGPPALPYAPPGHEPPPDMEAALARLEPPRKHYHPYYATRPANTDMTGCKQGLHAFLRAYYHHKSADWLANTPHRLAGWTAEAIAELPTYYVMHRHQTMAETVAHEMPSAAQIAENRWLPDHELAVYAAEYARTGFQGGLQWYRGRTTGLHAREMATFSGCTIDVPSAFIAGQQDWGVFQKPGDFEAMQTTACTQMDDVHLLDGAGHWVQQEKPEQVQALLLDFLRRQPTH